MAKLRSTSEMKDSGTRYLSEVPINWKVNKLKRYLRREEPKNPGNVPVLSLYRELGIVLKDSRDDNHNVTSENTSNYKYVQVGDFVVNKMKAWQGSVAVSEYEGIVSPAYYVYHFMNNAFNRRYFHYLLRGAYKEEFMSLSGGIRIGQWDLPSDALDNVLVLVPPLSEQQAIANYLDNQCSKIDEIITEATASIEEYKELKQAVILEAVTKGLDKTVPMKDSNIYYIGNTPFAWQLVKNKYLVRIENGSDPTLDGDIPVYGSGANSFKTCGEYKVGPTVLLGRKGATLHIPHYITGFYWNVDTAFNTVCISDNLHLKFFYYAARCFDYKAYISQTTLPGMTQTSYRNMKIALPPLQEQNAIVDYLDKQIERLEDLISEKQALIDDLQAYKKSLIYEVVTGKRRVV